MITKKQNKTNCLFYFNLSLILATFKKQMAHFGLIKVAINDNNYYLPAKIA